MKQADKRWFTADARQAQDERTDGTDKREAIFMAAFASWFLRRILHPVQMRTGPVAF